MTNNYDIRVHKTFDKNLWHCHPLNIRLMNVTDHASVALNKFLTNRNWNSRVVACLSTGVFVSGRLVAIPCAIVESVASITLHLLGVLANNLTYGQFPSIRKFNFKCLAYFGEIGIQTSITVNMLALRKFPTYHTEVTVVDHIPHLIMAAFAHVLRLVYEVSKRPEREREQYLDALAPSIITLVIEGVQGALDETMRSISRDFGVRNHFGNFHLSQQSQDLLVREIRNLNPGQLRDVSYRNNIVQNIQPVWLEIQREFNVHLVDEMIEVGLQGNEAKYQEHLFACTKEAIKRVYADERLANCIGGREAIAGVYPEPTIPLAKMAQLEEIEKFSDPESVVKCPEKFNGHLAKYNTRHTSIRDLSEKLKILTRDEKDQLILRLLKGAGAVDIEQNLQHKAEFNALVIGIGKLGGEIHQGNLMGVLNLQLIVDDLAQGENLFAKAWQEAVEELTKTT